MNVLKMTMTVILAVIAAVALGVVLYMQRPEFGRAPRGERKARIEKSPFYHDGVIENDTVTRMMTGDDNIVTIIQNMPLPIMLGTSHAKMSSEPERRVVCL